MSKKAEKLKAKLDPYIAAMEPAGRKPSFLAVTPEQLETLKQAGIGQRYRGYALQGWTQ